MKKSFFLVIFMGVVIFAFAQNGVIQELTGEVELKHAGATVFVPAFAGDIVALNTIVSTGFRSTAIVAVGSSTIVVRPLTRLSLAEISAGSGTENINLNLQAGRVRVEVRPPAGTRTSFNVQSPSATASVRGTTFDSDTNNVDVIDGDVLFGNRQGPGVLISKGGSGSVGADGKVYKTGRDGSKGLNPSNPVGTESFGGGGLGNYGQADVEIRIEYEQ
ncbi:MAG: FecR family protein [Treponema sp.]|nr:FecR family protein [Treponema sp.]